MHRGNPSLTGVVQASGLRHFQRVKWELEGEFAVHLPLVAGPDLLYAIWLTGIEVEIYAIEKETGVIRWHWKPDQGEYAGQAHLYLDQDVLYYPVRAVQSQPGANLAVVREAFLYAFDAQTGHVRRRIPLPAIGNKPSYNLFALHEGIIYLNGGMKSIPPPPSPSAHYWCVAVDLQTEQLLWRTDMGVRLYSFSPVVAHGMVYLQTYDAAARGRSGPMHLHALDAQTGVSIWEYECARGSNHEFAVAGAEVFMISGGLEVIDASSGTRRWSLPYGPSPVTGSPTITDDLVCLSYEGLPTWIENEPHKTGEMVVLERESRRRLWSAKAHEEQYATEGAIVADNVLYTVWKHSDSVRGWSPMPPCLPWTRERDRNIGILTPQSFPSPW